jgi:hypothetical protein
MRLKNDSLRLMGMYEGSAGDKMDADVDEASWA